MVNYHWTEEENQERLPLRSMTLSMDGQLFRTESARLIAADPACRLIVHKTTVGSEFDTWEWLPANFLLVNADGSYFAQREYSSDAGTPDTIEPISVDEAANLYGQLPEKYHQFEECFPSLIVPHQSDFDGAEDLTALATIDQVHQLKNGLSARAQGGAFEGGDTAFRTLRQELRKHPSIYSKLPDFVRQCGNLDEFWGFIQPRVPTYRERREFLREAFAPVIEYLETAEQIPGVMPVTEVLARFDAAAVHAAWQKALDRRATDPEGAITAARTLLETVCKHILDDEEVDYDDNADLPKLWRLAAERLRLAPNQYQEEVFKAILGNCQSIVGNLAAIRNKVGDAHGKGRRPARPKAKHAELAVNLAGSMAAFLVATWEERSENELPA